MMPLPRWRPAGSTTFELWPPGPGSPWPWKPVTQNFRHSSPPTPRPRSRPMWPSASWMARVNACCQSLMAKRARRTEGCPPSGASWPGSVMAAATNSSPWRPRARDRLCPGPLRVGPGGSGCFCVLAAPVRDSRHRVVGPVLLGVSIRELAAEIGHAQTGRLFFYGPNGQPLDASTAGLSSLSSDVRQSVSSDHLMRVSATANGHAYAVAVSDWTMRGERQGYLGVGLPADRTVDTVFRLRLLLMAVFAGTALLVLVVGGLLARRITRPLEELVKSMVAGDLRHRAPVGPADEIGYLTSSFY